MLTAIPGVTVEVWYLGTKIQVAFDGHLEKNCSGEVNLEVVTPSFVNGTQFIGLLVSEEEDGRKVVFPNSGTACLEGEFHDCPVQIGRSKRYGNIPVTYFNKNHLDILQLSDDGSFIFWQIAIVSQKGELFLSVQDKYRGRSYRDGENIVCPEMARWPEFVRVLACFLQDSLKELPSLPSEMPVESLEIPSNSDEAVVEFFDPARGFGVLHGPNGRDARFFVTEVTPREGQRLIHFQRGHRVKVGSYRRNPEAKPDQLAFDAIGVKAL